MSSSCASRIRCFLSLLELKSMSKFKFVDSSKSLDDIRTSYVEPCRINRSEMELLGLDVKPTQKLTSSGELGDFQNNDARVQAKV